MDNLNSHIGKLREDFMLGSLVEEDVHKNPSQQFSLWMQNAVDANAEEPHAMHLSTVGSDGKPSGRIVYLREFASNQFYFYTNYDSKKSAELEANPNASLTFFWPALQRQVRIEGVCERCSEKQSDNYFNARPYDSKLGAWASNQSTVLRSRADLEERVEKFRREFPEDKIKRPGHWGGFILTAHYFEFWQGRKSRLHDRLSYNKEANGWKITRLAP